MNKYGIEIARDTRHLKKKIVKELSRSFLRQFIIAQWVIIMNQQPVLIKYLIARLI